MTQPKQPRCDVSEPWAPALGNRVRVQLNGECAWCQRPGRSIVVHGDRDGKTGVIISVEEHDHPYGHCYLVKYDVPIPVTVRFLGPYPHMSGGYSHAASELEQVL